MKNNRSLFPPLFGEIPTGGGGGGSSNKIQLAELPEASLEYKDRIVQYIGVTTDTLINGYFYKCVEHTTTEGGTITVTYSWDNIDVMVDNGLVLVKHEYNVNLTSSNNWYSLDANINNNNTDFVIGSLQVNSPNGNAVSYPNGYNDGDINVQIYVANDSGLSYYGKADVLKDSTFKVIAFVKEKEN